MGDDQPVPTALIDESECIGCTLCIQACPFDAIIGAAKRMHTVVESLCTGCRLCLPPCPVDCIAIVPSSPERLWSRQEAVAAGARVKAHKRRLERERLQHDARFAAREGEDALTEVSEASPTGLDRIAAIVARAVQRARKRRTDASR